MVYPALLPLLPLMSTLRLPVVHWTDAPHGRFKWTHPLRGKTKSGFCACAITFQTCSTTNCCVITQKLAAVRYLATEASRHAFDTMLKFCLKFAKAWQTFCTKALYELLSAFQAKFLNIYRTKQTFPAKCTWCIITQWETTLTPTDDIHFSVNVTCAEST